MSVPGRAILAFLVVACCCAAAEAGGEHERRLAAELVVMGGDVRRLTTGEGGPLEREGLIQRLNGALSSLPLLLRRANDDPKSVADLRIALTRSDWRKFSATLVGLQAHHPFDAQRLLPDLPSPELLALGASIHRASCAACHDTSAGDALLPAKNLAEQLKSMPREEFAARLLLGIRGDRTTSWHNPFSDIELASLIAWYGRAP